MKSSRQFGWGAVSLWAAITAVGWAIYLSPLVGQYNLMLSAWEITSGMWDISYPMADVMGGCLYGAINGLILGVGQWLILRNYAKEARSWIIATALGLGLGLALSLAPVLPLLTRLRVANGWDYGVELPYGVVLTITIEVTLLSMAIPGLTIGLSQWCVLGRWSHRL